MRKRYNRQDLVDETVEQLMDDVGTLVCADGAEVSLDFLLALEQVLKQRLDTALSQSYYAGTAWPAPPPAAVWPVGVAA